MAFRDRWNHLPDALPLTVNPLWRWPLDLRGALAWWGRSWAPLSTNVAIVVLSCLVWLWASPSLETAANPGSWMLGVWLRNLVLATLVAQSLHLIFHKHLLQGTARKYDPRRYPRKGRNFTFGDQYWDNVFWACASGVTIWSGFECLVLWAMAQGIAPLWNWSDGPVWFVAFFLLIPVWVRLYFYLIHRLLHTRALYRFHALHHRNTDVGPWSGLSMHPVEHLLYFGTVFVHFIVPSSPLHLTCHLMFFGLYAITTHTGFEGYFSKGKEKLHLGNFHHQMHHRFFEVNYGTLEIPMDTFFGTFHDGTEDGDQRMKSRLRARAGMRKGG